MPKREPNYYENSIAPALDSFLTQISFPRQGLSVRQLSQWRERSQGFDGVIGEGVRGIRPFYMQFKRPFAWSGNQTEVAIVADRIQCELDVEPESLFFKLQPKTKNQTQFQHNVLFALREQLKEEGLGDAAYVCPLFLDFDHYRTHVHLAGLRRRIEFIGPEPWGLSSVSITDSISGRVDFSSVPVFSGHVSIPPHETVTNANHNYSFRPDGQQVCFHSPKEISDGSILLSSWLNSLYDQTYDARWLNADEAENILMRIIQALKLELPEISREPGREPNWIERWLRFGKMLANDYSIEQFAFIDWEESRTRLR